MCNQCHASIVYVNRLCIHGLCKQVFMLIECLVFIEIPLGAFYNTLYFPNVEVAVGVDYSGTVLAGIRVCTRWARTMEYYLHSTEQLCNCSVFNALTTAAGSDNGPLYCYGHRIVINSTLYI